MKIRVADITDKGRELQADLPATDFPALAKAEQDGDCTFRAPVSVQLHVAREYDHIRVSGGFQTVVTLNCSRCLSEFTSELSSEFTIYYTESTGTSQDDEVELSEEDLIAVTFAGDEIDFSEQIAEQVLLELPYKPLCRQECLGICPRCGVDLNEQQCSCIEQSGRLAFSALKDFKVKQ